MFWEIFFRICFQIAKISIFRWKIVVFAQGYRHGRHITDVTKRVPRFQRPKSVINFLNFYMKLFDHYIQVFYGLFQAKNNILFWQFPINCELPKSGCFVIKKLLKSRFFRDYEKNNNLTISIVSSYEWSWQGGHFDSTKKMGFIIATLVRKNNRNCLRGTFQKTCCLVYLALVEHHTTTQESRH